MTCLTWIPPVHVVQVVQIDHFYRFMGLMMLGASLGTISSGEIENGHLGHARINRHLYIGIVSLHRLYRVEVLGRISALIVAMKVLLGKNVKLGGRGSLELLATCQMVIFQFKALSRYGVSQAVFTGLILRGYRVLCLALRSKQTLYTFALELALDILYVDKLPGFVGLSQLVEVD